MRKLSREFYLEVQPPVATAIIIIKIPMAIAVIAIFIIGEEILLL